MKFKKRFLILNILSLSLLAPALKSSANSMWKKDNIGWWYQNQDGSYPKSQWKTINSKWYYFDTSGYLLTNTKTPDGYFVNSNGEWVDKTSYKEMWKKDNIGWWYQNQDGSYPTKTWKEISNKWYYFNNSGYMVVNSWIGNFYVGKDGAMLTNTKTPDGYYVGEYGRKENLKNGFTFEVDDEYTYSEKLGNSGKFFVNQDDATEYATKALFADGEWGSQGYFSYQYLPVKYNGVVGWSIQFWKEAPDLSDLIKD